MELLPYIEIIWRRRYIITVTTLVTVIVVAIGVLMQTPVYRAATTLRVLTATSGSASWVEHNIAYADRLMNTYVTIATSSPMIEELIKRLNLNTPPHIEVQTLANTELLQIVVEDANPVVAKKAADLLAELLITQSQELSTGGGKSAQEILGDQLTQLENELNQAQSNYENLVAESPQETEIITATSRTIALKQETYAALLELYEQARFNQAIQANTLSVVDPADTPKRPVKPKRALNIGLGFIVGVAGGIGLAFLIENLDTTLYTTQQIERATTSSILGRVPRSRKKLTTPLFNSNSPQQEAFYHLRTTIFACEHTKALKTILITSAEPQEGKSTIAANLAVAIARTNQNVIVVDSDLRKPVMHEIFDLPNESGLSDILCRKVNLSEAIQNTPTPNLHILTSGTPTPHPTELLATPQMSELMAQLRKQFEMVLLDTPAFMAVTDASVLAPLVEGVLLVVGEAQAHEENIQLLQQQFDTLKIKPIGVVVNKTRTSNHHYHYYHTCEPPSHDHYIQKAKDY